MVIFIVYFILWIAIGFEFGYGFKLYLDYRQNRVKYTAIPTIEEEEEEGEKEEKWDVVYILKNDMNNIEELRYSLRSLKNFTYNKVWFVGGQPRGLKPDCKIPLIQKGDGAYSRVWNTLIEACQNDNITSKFYLFNDDFFILKKYNQYKNYYISDLDEHIVVHEDYYSSWTGYSTVLRGVNILLRKEKYPTLSYEIHMPMLIDKQEALKILLKYKGESLFRSIYGNIYHTTPIEKREDCKIFSLDVTITPDDWDTVSTTSETFNKLPVGKYIRESFPEKSKYEID